MNKKVCLRIDGVNHHLCEYKGYAHGSKCESICVNCSLYKTHYGFCWSQYGEPICLVLGKANNWGTKSFAAYFKTIKRK